MIANNEEQQRPRCRSLVLEEQLQVDLKDRLQQSHIRTLVQPNLMLPNIHQQHLTRRQRKQRTLPLKVLILASLSSIGTFDIHHHDIVGHASSRALGTLVLGHPDTLGRLLALILGHDTELGAEEVVEQCRLAGGLRAEDGDEVVVEACLGNMFELEVVADVGATLFSNRDQLGEANKYLLELLVLVNHLYAMLEAAFGWLLAHASHMAVHDVEVKIGVRFVYVEFRFVSKLSIETECCSGIGR